MIFGVAMDIYCKFKSIISGNGINQPLIEHFFNVGSPTIRPINTKLDMSSLIKNLGRIWLAYAELQVSFYSLRFVCVDPGHLTQSELWL